jgi:hypothetical protein
MAVTHKLIQTVSVTAATVSSIDFNSIPQTYTDLVLVVSMRTNAAGVSDYVAISFNSSTASFTFKPVYGDGTSALSANYTTSPSSRIISAAVGNTATANVFSSGTTYIPNYTSSNNKSYSSDYAREQNATGTELGFGAGIWANTAAITSISLTSWNGSSIMQYSSASLYGIIKS